MISGIRTGPRLTLPRNHSASTLMLQRILSDPFALVLVVLFFGASIFIHELGHFLAARWRGLRIERFSIGFGPRLFGWRDKQGVDWRVSLIPLGGYVALPQLADMRGIEGDPSAEAAALPPISYADKMIVSVAGAFFNVLFALAIATVLWGTGLPVAEEMESTTVGYVAAELQDSEGFSRPSPAAVAGLQPGDRILEIDGDRVRDWEDILYGITTGALRSPNGNPMARLKIERADTTLDLDVFPMLDPFEGIRRIGISPAHSLIVGGTMPNSPAAIAGLQPKDRIIAVDDTAIFHSAILAERIQAQPEQPMRLTVQRGDAIMEIPIRAESVVYNTNGDTLPLIGVQWERLSELRHINPFSQIGDALSTTVQVLFALFNPRTDIGINNLSGPVGISYTLYVLSRIGILEVLSVVVLININLAILNLLPIPVLDGGHMAFATIAKLRGRPVPPTLMASAQGVFMLLFFAIFIYVTFFDIGRVHRNESAISEAERAANQRVPIEFSGNPQPGIEDVKP